MSTTIQILPPAELREIDFPKLEAIAAIPEGERYDHAASMDLKTLGRFIQPAIDCAEALVEAYRPYLLNFRKRTAHQGEQKLLTDGSGKSVTRDELCRQTIGVGIRRLNQLLKVTDPDAPAPTKNDAPPLAIGAEVIVIDSGHPAVVVHQNVTIDRVDVDETFPDGEQPVRKSYKRSELLPLSEWLTQQKKQERKDEAIEDGLAPESDPPADDDDEPAQPTAPAADEIALGLLKGEEQEELKAKAVDYLNGRSIEITPEPIVTQKPDEVEPEPEEPEYLEITEAEALAIVKGQGVLEDKTSTGNHNSHRVTFERGGRCWQLFILYYYGKPQIQNSRYKVNGVVGGYQCQEAFPVVVTEYRTLGEVGEVRPEPKPIVTQETAPNSKQEIPMTEPIVTPDTDTVSQMFVTEAEADERYTDEDEGRRKPKYHIVLEIEGSRLETMSKKAKEAFGDALKTVEKCLKISSRADSLDQASGLLQEAQGIVEELKGEMEEWRDSIPESLQSGEKASEVEDCIGQLEELESSLGDISFENVEFPSMY